MTVSTRSPNRDVQLALMLARLVQFPVDDDGLLRFHEHDRPESDTEAQSALRRALSEWRTGTLEAGADIAAAGRVLNRLDATLAAVDAMLGEPRADERSALLDSLTSP